MTTNATSTQAEQISVLDLEWHNPGATYYSDSVIGRFHIYLNRHKLWHAEFEGYKSGNLYPTDNHEGFASCDDAKKACQTFLNTKIFSALCGVSQAPDAESHLQVGVESGATTPPVHFRESLETLADEISTLYPWKVHHEDLVLEMHHILTEPVCPAVKIYGETSKRKIAHVCANTMAGSLRKALTDARDHLKQTAGEVVTRPSEETSGNA
jgi:hypothetical protein